MWRALQSELRSDDHTLTEGITAGRPVPRIAVRLRVIAIITTVAMTTCVSAMRVTVVIFTIAMGDRPVADRIPVNVFAIVIGRTAAQGVIDTRLSVLPHVWMVDPGLSSVLAVTMVTCMMG